MFCTTGILLRQLEGDSELSGITHVIVDEVHERTEERFVESTRAHNISVTHMSLTDTWFLSLSDFLLLVLKDLIVKRMDLKIIMMSATLNAELFSQYFNKCPTIHIPGTIYHITGSPLVHL